MARKLTVLATALASLLALSAVALAGEATSPSGQVQTLDAGHSSTKASTRKRSRGTYVTIKLSLRRADAGKASPTTGAVVHLPRGIRLNYRDFPACDQNKLESDGPRGCPRKSKVGRGRIRADARPVVTNEVGGTVTAFNGKRRTYLLYVVPEISSPLVIPGRLKGSRSKPRLDFDVPLVPTLPGQPNATLTYFEVKTGGKVKKRKRVRGKRRRVTVNYIENARRCGKSGWDWKIDFTYENGERLSPTDEVRCRR
jgi:hypothetical protein